MKKIVPILIILAIIAIVLVQPSSASDGKITQISDDEFISYIWDIAWVPGEDDTAILVGGYDEGEIWEYNDNDKKYTIVTTGGLELTDADLQSIAWKPDGSYALIVGRTFNVGAIALKYDGETVTGFENTNFSYYDNFNAVEWDPKGNYALIGGGSANHGKVHRFDGESFEVITPNFNPLPTRGISDLAWAPSGEYCLMVGDYANVIKYQNDNFTLLNLQVDNVIPYKGYNGIGWRPDGAYALIVGSQGKIVKFDGDTFTNITSNTNETLIDVTWSPDSEYALIVSEDGMIFEFDGNEVTPIFKEEWESNINAVAWKPDGSHALIVGSGLVLSYSTADVEPEPNGNNGGPSSPESTEPSHDGFVLNTTTFGIIGAVGISALLVAVVVGTEIGKYKFFAYFSSLYTKLKRKKILSHGTRNMIQGYITANPGDHYNAIRRVLKLNNGALAYHLRVLEREGFIRSMRDGVRKRFYPIGVSAPQDRRLSSIQQRIIDTIKVYPGISQIEIAAQIGVSKQVVNYHINILVGANIVRLERVGNKTCCYDNR